MTVRHCGRTRTLACNSYEASSFSQGCQIGFFDAKFHKFGFFRGRWRQKNYLAFFLQYLAFLEAVRICYQIGVLAFKDLAEKCY